MDQAKYQAMLRTADAFNGVLRRHFVKDGKAHPVTIVSAAARMAGTLLFRSFDIDLRRIRPGSVVLSAQADAGIPNLGRLLHARSRSGYLVAHQLREILSGLGKSGTELIFAGGHKFRCG